MTEEQAKKIDETIRRVAPEGLKKKEPHPDVKHVIGIVSGKGGVGKSLITAMLAVEAQRRGYQTAVLDGDITGPSIPKMFGVHDKAKASGDRICPVCTRTGIQLMSMNLLMEDETQPVIWRGPVIAGAVKQFWTDVLWESVDLMFVDMPPGTGDVPLTVFQSLPVEGIIVVTSPQQLVEMIVSKAVRMADTMKIPVLGLVENFSYFECPDCHRRHEIFGKSSAEELCQQFSIPVSARIPVDPAFASLADQGKAEEFDTSCLREVFETGISGLLKKGEGEKK